MTTSPISDDDRATAAAAYRALNDSPMQRRLRERKDWFIGSVWWAPGDCDLDELARELRRMKDLGFTIVRYHNCDPVALGPEEFDFSRADAWMDAAGEAGLGVWFHLSRDNKIPTDAMLAKHGLTREQWEQSHLEEGPALEAVRDSLAPLIERFRGHEALYGWAGFGEPGGRTDVLSRPFEQKRFGQWLREQYGSLEALDAAWNIYPTAGRLIVDDWDEAWRWGLGPDAVGISGVENAKKVYGGQRDMMRYVVERGLDRTGATLELIRELDPDHPVSVGTHQLFANQPSLRWDTAAYARLGELHFSSIHLSWHFQQTPPDEIDAPVLMQAKLTRDFFKGGWTSAYETTGGPVQYSGGRGNAMTPGLMRRLCLAYLAAGNENISFWTWNARPGGWEVGEYGLTTLSGTLSPWAEEAGNVARAMDRWHGELWEASEDVRVGLVSSWDTQAIYTCEPEREGLPVGPSEISRGTKMQPQWAQIGAARALLDSHTPFEYVTEAELLEGIALCYPALYAPHLRAVSDELLDALEAYVRDGGRLVADVQFGFLDRWGKLRRRGKGSQLERLFGAWADAIHDTRTEPRRIGPIEVEGFYGQLELTDARVLARFQDDAPAVTEHTLGSGSALLIGFDAARMCHLAGREDVQRLITDLCWADGRPAWRCDAPLAVRRTAPGADHYFLLNEGPDRMARITAYDCEYATGLDVLTGREIDVAGTVAVDLPARSGTWVRLERRGS